MVLLGARPAHGRDLIRGLGTVSTRRRPCAASGVTGGAPAYGLPSLPSPKGAARYIDRPGSSATRVRRGARTVRWGARCGRGAVAHYGGAPPRLPPVKPMLAKAIYEVPRTGGLLVRAQVGRLPLPGVPRRRRRRAVELHRPAAEPLLPRDGRRACGPSCPTAAWSTASWWSSPATASTSTPCSCGSTPPSRGSTCWPPPPARSWRSTCWRSTTVI